MKKLLIIALLIIGCSKTSTAAPDCTAFGTAFQEAVSAYQTCTGTASCATACANQVTVFQAGIDAGCPGYDAETIAPLETTCDLIYGETVYGCTDSEAWNYSPTATTPCNNGTDNDCCQDSIVGCTDSSATNYNPLANTSCSDCCVY